MDPYGRQILIKANFILMFYYFLLKYILFHFFFLQHEAVKSGNLDIIKKLIEFGALINVPGYEYETPLHTAMKYCRYEIASMLVQNGADINCQNMYGVTAQ